MEIKNVDDIKNKLHYNLTEKDKLLYYETILNNPYIKITPYPKQVLTFLLANRFDTDFNKVLTGGRAYGGKTFVLSALALQYAKEKNYRCLVVRKNYADLVNVSSIMDNIGQWTVDEPTARMYKSAQLMFKFESGAEIHFKAYDRSEARNKLRGTSFHRIIVDESSQIDESILRYLFRSLRKPKGDPIPLSVIFASNPLGPSNQYHIDEFIEDDSPNPYVALGYTDNPYIDVQAYEKSLLELPKIDRISQMLGDWKIQLDEGLLISSKDYDEILIDKMPTESIFNVVSIDFASTGMDKTALTSISLGKNGKKYLVDSLQLPDQYIEDAILKFVKEQQKKHGTYYVITESEPGSASEYSARYWYDLFKQYVPQVLHTTERPVKSKFERTRPTASQILSKDFFIVKNQDTDRLREEFMHIHPDKKVMRMRKSPNLLDSLNQGLYVLGNITGTGLIGNGLYARKN